MESLKPRVVIMALASDFGCQLQITNAEPYLLDILSQFELLHWQLIDSEPMPEDFDVVIIEGAVVAEREIEHLVQLREKVKVVIAIGACAVTGGVCGLARLKDDNFSAAYTDVPIDVKGAIAARPVSDVIKVDYEVVGCPINTMEFIRVLQRAVSGLTAVAPKGDTLCGTCKLSETVCFYSRGQLCLGLVTNDGCGALCTRLQRPCFGCRGLSANANIEQARCIALESGIAVADFNKALDVFNAATHTAVLPAAQKGV